MATRSERDGAPVLIWPVPMATTRSAMVVSSVSPERCDDDGRPAGAAGQVDRVDRLGQRPDLVELDEDASSRPTPRSPRAIRSVFVTSRSSPTSWTRLAEPLGQLLPAGPVVLGQAVLDRDDRVARGPVGPQVDELAGLERPALAWRARSGSAAIDAGARLDELGRRRVERDRDVLAGPVAGPLDGPQDDLDRGLVGRQGRGEAALVTLAGRVALVVEDRPERREDLGARPAAPRRTSATPTGMTMNSWKSVESWACLPPLRMLNIGTGRVRAPTPPR